MRKRLIHFLLVSLLLLTIKNIEAKEKGDGELKKAVEEFKLLKEREEHPGDGQLKFRHRRKDMEIQVIPERKEMRQQSFRKQSFQPVQQESQQNVLRKAPEEGWRPRFRRDNGFQQQGGPKQPLQIKIQDGFKGPGDSKDWGGKGFFKDQLEKREHGWDDRGNLLRKKFGEHRKKHHIFDKDFWSRFRSLHRNWFFDQRFSWFGVRSWSSISRLLPWRLNTPILYYYDDSGRVYFALNLNRPYFLPVESNRDLDIDIFELADSRPYFSTDQRDWFSLGTFALFNDKDGSQMPQEYVSLAVSKDGAISGAYLNVYNGRPIEIEGAIDKLSQRIAWKFVGQDWPVMETGLYNLTIGETTFLEHSSRYRRDARVMIQIQE